MADPNATTPGKVDHVRFRPDRHSHRSQGREPRTGLRARGSSRCLAQKTRRASGAPQATAQHSHLPDGRRRLGRLRLLRRGRRGRRADAEHRPAGARRACCSRRATREPSCTPSRATTHDRPAADAPRSAAPADVRRAGRLAGRDHASPSCLSEAGYVTQAVGKWHMGENVESQPQNVGFDDFYGFLSVSDMYTEWRDPYFFPEIVYSEARTEWVENMPFNKCFVHATQGRRASRTSRRSRSRCCRCSTTSGADYSVDFIRSAWPPETKPWFLYHCTRGAHFDNYPHERFLGRSPAQAPVQGHHHRARRHRGAAGRGAAQDRPARGHAGLHLVGQRAGDGDVARRRLHAVPLRQGLDLGRRRARAGHLVVAGHDRGRATKRRALQLQRRAANAARAWRARLPSCRPTATSTASTRARSCWPPMGYPIASITTTGWSTISLGYVAASTKCCLP